MDIIEPFMRNLPQAAVNGHQEQPVRPVASGGYANGYAGQQERTPASTES